MRPNANVAANHAPKRDVFRLAQARGRHYGGANMTQETTNDATHGAEEGSSDLFNTAAGWVLFAAGLGLGLSIVAGKFFHGDSPQAPEVPGYVIQGVDTGTDEVEVTIAEVLNTIPSEELVAAGERAFAKCQACHTVDQGGANGVGPNLHGIMGASAGGVAGFGYSTAMTGFGGTWGWDEMNEWLDSPRGYMNGTTMTFNGVSRIEDRAAIALYLNANGSNLELPEFVPVAEAEAEADADVEGAAEAEQNAAESTSVDTAEAEAGA